MANETKVGLLAGLAFITCFAIILANRGREVGIDRFLPQFAANTPVKVEEDAAQPNQFTAIGDLARAQDQPNTLPGSGGARTGDLLDPNADSGRREGNTSGPMRTVSRPQSDDPRGSKRDLERRIDELTAELAQKQQPDAERSEPDQSVPLTSLTPGNEQDSTRLPNQGEAETSPVESSTTKPSPPRDSLKYTVVSGDTLSSIAKAFYGTRSNTAINAIFDANRRVLPSPGELRADIVLDLPNIHDVGAPKHKPEARFAERPPAKPDRDPTAQFRWYQIRKNDRYLRIAREQLGNADRWNEIFELNKDKFPDPSKIREGVRIKLPLGNPVSTSQRG